MAETALALEFQQIPTFAELPAEQLAWLADQAEVIQLAPSEVLFREGDPATSLLVFLEGEIHFRSDSAGPEAMTYIAQPGEVGGVLPLSRMTHHRGTSRALLPSRVAAIQTTIFPEMLARMPQLNQRLAGIMSDRIREVASLEQQRDKLLALGKLSAGLAHELNNPASAAGRSIDSLGEALSAIRRSTVRLAGMGLAAGEWEILEQIEQEAAQPQAEAGFQDALTRSDREDRLAGWLERNHVPNAWTLAPALAESEFDEECLDALAQRFRGECLAEALEHLCATLTANQLLHTAATSIERISSLLQAVKDYSYMDQAPVQDIDIHKGLESTLTILGHRLNGSIRLVRRYDCNLPRVPAHGGELNQVWTNLIDNALDAMDGQGELRLRTAWEVDRVLVEVGDTGPGIPEKIQLRIFEPFFTTKSMGQGTGLGLDAVHRIVRKHHGTVQVESAPGNTRFLVRLPISGSPVER